MTPDSLRLGTAGLLLAPMIPVTWISAPRGHSGIQAGGHSTVFGAAPLDYAASTVTAEGEETHGKGTLSMQLLQPGGDTPHSSSSTSVGTVTGPPTSCRRG